MNAVVDAVPWTPDPLALTIDHRVAVSEGGPDWVRVEHLGAPYSVLLDQADEPALQSAGLAYLRRLSTVAPQVGALIQPWVDALASCDPDAGFAWVPLESSDPNERLEPARSQWRSFADSSQSVILFAGQTVQRRTYLASGFGLRVAMRLIRVRGGLELAIHALAVSLPYGRWRGAMLPIQVSKVRDLDLLLLEPVVLTAIDLIRLPSIGIRGLRVAADEKGVTLELRISAASSDDDPAPWSARVLGRTDTGEASLLQRERQSAPMHGEARVFSSDPMSDGSAMPRHRRPRRNDLALDRYRSTEPILRVKEGPLEDLRPPHLRVRVCPRYVREDRPAPPDAVRKVELPGDGPAVRSNDASAVQAFRHGREMLDRMRQYGIDPGRYFRLTRPQLDLHYRTGVSPGPGKDGRTINARVLAEGGSNPDFFKTKRVDELPWPGIHLGVADLGRRERRARRPGDPPSAAIWLGISADPRWMWHEFGHVLLLAATGELEFRFAHSPGDALAAIASDPDAEAGFANSRWRFVSFPWVMLSRRHDRCVLAGWGWNGRRREGVAALPEYVHPLDKGYDSEQVLSSTLFRLYRCLGGDTHAAGEPARPDRPARRGAAHYALCLIMEAIELLGDARLVPAHRPEDFALALMLADVIRPRPWEVTTTTGSPGRYRRVPGCAWKLVRWAFEAQGLYTLPGGDVDAPGAPPPVDVFIASRRPETEDTPYGPVRHGPGNYLPVSLHWQGRRRREIPAWQAAASAVVVKGRHVWVKVGNRGRETAVGVKVDLWQAAWPAKRPAPEWQSPSARWSACGFRRGAQDIPPGACVTFGPFKRCIGQGRQVLLAAATCRSDTSNIDRLLGTGGRRGVALTDLVGGDNNLGVCVIDELPPMRRQAGRRPPVKVRPRVPAPGLGSAASVTGARSAATRLRRGAARARARGSRYRAS